MGTQLTRNGFHGRAGSARRLFTGLLADRSGNIALLFSLTLPFVLMAVGGAVDFSMRNMAYSKLLTCADAATLSAVSQQGLTNAKAAAEDAMLKFFDGNCPNAVSQLGKVKIDATSAVVTDAGGARTATLTFTASRDTEFLKVAGFNTLPLNGISMAKAGTAPYIDFYALLDNSSSMGLGSTSVAQAQLRAVTPDNCSLACHILGAKTDNYTIARKYGIETRIDVLRNSWISLIKQAKASPSSDRYRFATYIFNSSVSINQTLTGDYNTALASANGIDLELVPVTGPGSTHTDAALTTMVPNIPPAGDGMSANTSLKYLLLVTDGVQDFLDYTAIDTHRTQVITPSQCDAFKKRGIQVVVIYTTYVYMDDYRYKDLVQPIATKIAPALQACASPGLYFEAPDGPDIQSAITGIYTIATGGRARVAN